jgi:hypothetical protein
MIRSSLELPFVRCADYVARFMVRTPEFLTQIETWERQVTGVLHESARGRMISEWAKKQECRNIVFSASYSPVALGIPEVRYDN